MIKELERRVNTLDNCIDVSNWTGEDFLNLRREKRIAKGLNPDPPPLRLDIKRKIIWGAQRNMQFRLCYLGLKASDDVYLNKRAILQYKLIQKRIQRKIR